MCDLWPARLPSWVAAMSYHREARAITNLAAQYRVHNHLLTRWSTIWHNLRVSSSMRAS